MIWNYLRSKVRESILAGVNDALVEIDGPLAGNATADATVNSLAALRQRLQPALPAPLPVEAPAASAETDTPTPATTRRSRKAEVA